jgi:hypothetical protein
LEPLALPENQRMRITLHLPVREQPEELLAALQQVSAGLSDGEIDEIETIARRR